MSSGIELVRRRIAKKGFARYSKEAEARRAKNRRVEAKSFVVKFFDVAVGF